MVATAAMWTCGEKKSVQMNMRMQREKTNTSVARDAVQKVSDKTLCTKQKQREEENAQCDMECKMERGRACKDIEKMRKELKKVLHEKKQAGAELRLMYEQVDLLDGEKKIWD